MKSIFKYIAIKLVTLSLFVTTGQCHTMDYDEPLYAKAVFPELSHILNELLQTALKALVAKTYMDEAEGGRIIQQITFIPSSVR